jgi:Peptidase M15
LSITNVMRRFTMFAAVTVALSATVAVTVAVTQRSTGDSRAASPHPQAQAPAVDAIHPAHPHAVQPQAGASSQAGDAGPVASSDAIIGDPSAHAPSLAQIKRELKILNMCGGTTSSAFAAPVVAAAGAGFTPDPGTQQTQGQLPLLTRQLDALGKALGVTIYGISGYRTPAHSVAVGGFADDPHTRGQAEDIGVGSLLRSSAAQISEAELARFGLYRPFDPSGDPNNSEVNHIQLIPSGGPLSLRAATSAWSRDPRCQ